MYEKEVLLIYLRDPSNREYYVYIQVTTLSPKALYIHIYIYILRVNYCWTCIWVRFIMCTAQGHTQLKSNSAVPYVSITTIRTFRHVT